MSRKEELKKHIIETAMTPDHITMAQGMIEAWLADCKAAGQPLDLSKRQLDGLMSALSSTTAAVEVGFKNGVKFAVLKGTLQ